MTQVLTRASPGRQNLVPWSREPLPGSSSSVLRQRAEEAGCRCVSELKAPPWHCSGATWLGAHCGREQLNRGRPGGCCYVQHRLVVVSVPVQLPRHLQCPTQSCKGLQWTPPLRNKVKPVQDSVTGTLHIAALMGVDEWWSPSLEQLQVLFVSSPTADPARTGHYRLALDQTCTWLQALGDVTRRGCCYGPASVDQCLRLNLCWKEQWPVQALQKQWVLQSLLSLWAEAGWAYYKMKEDGLRKRMTQQESLGQPA